MRGEAIELVVLDATSQPLIALSFFDALRRIDSRLPVILIADSDPSTREEATEFDAFLRLVRSTVAEPPWFAAPVDAREDGAWYVLSFYVAGRHPLDLSVTGNEHTLTVWGARRADGPKHEMRMCTLPESIDSRSIELVQKGPVLTVRVRKKRSDRPPKGAITR